MKLQISVIVPTFKRTNELCRCLSGLQAQSRKPEQVIVVVRAGDDETLNFIEQPSVDSLSLQVVLVHEPGVIAALNAGLTAATGAIVAIIDDDAVPQEDWLHRIEEKFVADPLLIGLGGRDCVHNDGAVVAPSAAIVGRVQWCGKVVGNHHIGIGQPRQVDVLKAVNCAYRTRELRAIGFDERLRGTGAQRHFELSLGLQMIRKGWTLMYDPSLLVDHYPAQRHDRDERNQFDGQALSDAAYNQSLALLENLQPLRRCIFVPWAFLIGDSEFFGIIQCLRFFPAQRIVAVQKLFASWQGRIDALRDWHLERARR